ncbi:MAG: ATP-binding protein, partial [Thaumarchaeota archaeon]|nr:ATP-binding protein [Nitrososphaerota archaeon]
RAISRISHQLDNVLDFVRIQPLQFSNASIHEIIVASISSIKTPQNIIIENTVDDVSIVCDPKNIEIVFTNLILNAIQALDEKGKIRIRSIKLDSWIVIEVEDDGPTIPDNVLSQIFDPLFTTKQTGTGLGLSSSKNIVEQHGGNITLKNNPTTFSVKLPLQLSVPKTDQQRDR